MGKALLSELSEPRVDEIIDQHGLPARTENTITDRDTLKTELETIRERGYAIDNEEYTVGVRCIGVPVHDRDGTVLGSISVTGPARRIRGTRLHDDIPDQLFEAANVIQLHTSFS